jgi:hypothetical protein
MCTVLYYCHRVATQLQLTDVSFGLLQMYGGAVQSEEEPSVPPAQQFEEDHNVPGLLCRWTLLGDGRMWAPALSEGVGPPGRRRGSDCGVCGSQVRDLLRRKYALIATARWTTRGSKPGDAPGAYH